MSDGEFFIDLVPDDSALQDLDDEISADVSGEVDAVSEEHTDEISAGLGGVAAKLGKIGAVVGVVSQLEAVIELLSGVMRILELFIMPLVALFNAVIRPILERLAMFIGDLDFDHFVGEVRDALAWVGDHLLEGFTQVIPFVDEGGVRTPDVGDVAESGWEAGLDAVDPIGGVTRRVTGDRISPLGFIMNQLGEFTSSWFEDGQSENVLSSILEGGDR